MPKSMMDLQLPLLDYSSKAITTSMLTMLCAALLATVTPPTLVCGLPPSEPDHPEKPTGLPAQAALSNNSLTTV